MWGRPKGTQAWVSRPHVDQLSNGCSGGCKPPAFGHWGFESLLFHQWGCLVLGQAPHLQCGIRGFDSLLLHQISGRALLAKGRTSTLEPAVTSNYISVSVSALTWDVPEWAGLRSPSRNGSTGTIWHLGYRAGPADATSEWAGTGPLCLSVTTLCGSASQQRVVEGSLLML